MVFSELVLLDLALMANPACPDITVTQFVQILAMDFLSFTFWVAFRAQAHDVLVLPRSVQMRSPLRIAGIWTLAGIVATFLEKVIVSIAPWTVTKYPYLAHVDTALPTRQGMCFVALGSPKLDFNRFILPDLSFVTPHIAVVIFVQAYEVLPLGEASTITKALTTEHIEHLS
jgi:hypothetical protein